MSAVLVLWCFLVDIVFVTVG